MKSYVLPAVLLAMVLGGCTFTQKIKSGADAFSVKQYAVAAQMLEEEYSASSQPSERAMKAFMIGQSYEFMREPASAVGWYAKAYEAGYGLAAREKQAEMLRQTEQYTKAAEIYQELMNTGTDPQRYRGLVTLCNQAAQWKKEEDKSPYRVKSASFNSPSSDYGPYVLGPDLILFTSDRSQSNGNQTYQWTGRDFSDLYTINLSTGAVQPFDHVLNTTDNEGMVAMTADRSEMYFTRCFQGGAHDSYCKLMMCTLRGASWSEPVVLPFTQDGVNYGHPALAGKDSILIFSADAPDGQGGYDLYYSVRGARGWGEPVTMGPRLNTIGNERFPAMHKDTLYFSSDGHPGLGGYDIFKSYLDASGNWTPPLNLKPPINSGWDDFGFVVDTFNKPSGQILEKGYFSSSRNSATGDDIFSYEKMIRKETPAEPATPSESKPISYHLYLAIRVVEPQFAVPGDPNSARIGKIPLNRAAINVAEGKTMNRAYTDEDGRVILELEYGKEYTFDISKKGFLKQYRAFSSTAIKKDPANPIVTENMEVVLERIFENMEIVLQDIYYDYEEWFIREDAKPSLDKLATILKENPGIKIQLSSHTDCRGDDTYNQDLSQKRARSAVEYLIGKGISAERLTPVGYGESRLAVDCVCTQCTEEEHQKNRRTTFKILANQ